MPDAAHRVEAHSDRCWADDVNFGQPRLLFALENFDDTVPPSVCTATSTTIARNARRSRYSTAVSLRPARSAGSVLYTTKLAIQTLGRRVLDLEADTTRLDRLLDELVSRTAPSLAAVYDDARLFWNAWNVMNAP